MNIGYQKNITDSEVLSIPIETLIEGISTSERVKDIVADVRSADNKVERNKAKSKLPCVIISADTCQRKAHEDDVHTGLIFIDIDGCGEENPPLNESKAIVDSMDYDCVIGYAVSPSGHGLKVLCGVEADIAKHKMSFKALEDLFLSHGLAVDRACKDFKRVTYIPYDPDAKETLEAPYAAYNGAAIIPAKPVERKQYTYTPSSSSSSLSPDEEASLCLQHISPDIEYAEWVNVGMALKQHGVSCGVWDSWSASSQLYRDGECDRKWATFSGDGVKFATVVKMAMDNNGGRNPINAEKNQREVVKATDFDVVEEDAEEVVQEVTSEEPTYYFCNGKYYMLDDSKTRYIGIGSEDLTRQLRAHGYSMKGEEGEMSPIDKIKANIVLKNTVDFVGQVAGREIGITSDKTSGVRHLIPRKNTRIEAKEGDWTDLRVMLEGLYGDQLPYIYSWLHRARRQLNEGQFMMGHALAIAGQKGGGKSLTAEKVIGPLLGGTAKAHRYLTGATDFNADLCGSELLILDDEGGSRSMVDRKKMGHSLKQSTAGSSSVSRHGKGFDAYNVHPLWRIVVCMNDDADAIGAFPPLGESDCDSLGDKVLLIKCFTTELPFSRDRDSFYKMDKMIGDALPAFAHFLDSYKTPESIQTGLCRFGFDEFHHPDLLAVLNEHSNPRTLLSATDWLLFSGQGGHGLDVSVRDGKRYCDVKALDWGMALLNRDSNLPARMRNTVEGELFGITARSAQKTMQSVADVSGDRVTKVTIQGARYWRIWENPEESPDPF
jgi:hypothetical protein